MTAFYDELAPFYHLIHQDWNASIHRQGEQLSSIVKAEWSAGKRILDVSCGIGTQAIGLAMEGYEVRGSDLSEEAIRRATREARNRNLDIPLSVCDMRNAHDHHGSGFDVVISCDNSFRTYLTTRTFFSHSGK